MFHRSSRRSKRNQVSYLNHYAYDKDGIRVSLPRRLRNIWLEEEKEYIQNTHSPVYIICGEFSSTETAAVALSKGYEVKVICGERMFNEESRDTVADLKDKYGRKFVVSIYALGKDKRPPYHSALIGRNILFENKHTAIPNDASSEYTVAKVIEHIDDDGIKQYQTIFKEYLKQCKEEDVSAQYIRTMNLLDSPQE